MTRNPFRLMGKGGEIISGAESEIGLQELKNFLNF